MPPPNTNWITADRNLVHLQDTVLVQPGPYPGVIVGSENGAPYRPVVLMHDGPHAGTAVPVWYADMYTDADAAATWKPRRQSSSPSTG